MLTFLSEPGNQACRSVLKLCTLAGVASLMLTGALAALAPQRAAAVTGQVFRPAAASAPSSNSPGTNIGNAGQLTSTGSGTIGTDSDDWWVIYPARNGGQVKVTVSDNAGQDTSCTEISASLDGTDGASQSLDSEFLNPGTSGQLIARASGSDRYYVEVTPSGCASGAPYTITLNSGGGGRTPNPVSGRVSAGVSIGSAWPPLRGHTRYATSLTFNGNQEKWYVLFKKPDSSVATIRVQNTTDSATSGCAEIDANLYSADGYSDEIGNLFLNNNDAGLLFVPANQDQTPGGLYYLEIVGDSFCGGSGAANFTFEPEPAAQFTSPARVPAGQHIPPGDSIGNPWPPLQGGLRYSAGMTFNGGQENWYVLFKQRDSHVATIRVVNTTIDGSGGCSEIDANLYDNQGYNNEIGNLDLSGNQAGVISVPPGESGDPRGLYYLQIVGDSFCGGSGSANYTMELEPKAEFANQRRERSGKAAASPSLRRAWPPLRGGASLRGSINFAANTQNWYLLYKRPDTHSASITVSNTTVDGFTSCSDLDANLYTNRGLGGQVGSLSVSGNEVASMAIPGRQGGDPEGIYYLQITGDSFCGGSGAANYTIDAEPGGQFAVPALKVIVLRLKTGTVGKAYRDGIVVSKGKQPYSFTAKTKLPPGLKLNRRTGVVSGKPTRKGSYKFTVRIADSSKPKAKSVTYQFSITIRRA
jgi:hypothetical protein